MENTAKVFKTSQKIRENVSRYQKEHREQVSAKSKRAYYRMKEDPVRYQAFKDKRKKYISDLKQKKEELVKKLEEELAKNKIIV